MIPLLPTRTLGVLWSSVQEVQFSLLSEIKQNPHRTNSDPGLKRWYYFEHRAKKKASSTEAGLLFLNVHHCDPLLTNTAVTLLKQKQVGQVAPLIAQPWLPSSPAGRAQPGRSLGLPSDSTTQAVLPLADFYWFKGHLPFSALTPAPWVSQKQTLAHLFCFQDISVYFLCLFSSFSCRQQVSCPFHFPFPTYFTLQHFCTALQKDFRTV